MGVAAEVDELEGDAEEGGGLFGFGGAHGGGAVGAGFAAGADHEMNGPAGGGLKGDDPAGAEFDVVGVGTEGEERRKQSGGGRHGSKIRRVWSRKSMQRAGTEARGGLFGVGFVGAVDGVAGDEGDLGRVGVVEVGLFAGAGDVVRAMDHGLHPTEAAVA